MNKYQPTGRDLDWARRTLAILKDGGVLGIPRNEQVFTVSHTDKLLVLVHGPLVDLHKFAEVFQAVGYATAVSQLCKPREEVNRGTRV